MALSQLRLDGSWPTPMTGCSRLVDAYRIAGHLRYEERSADLKTNKPLILTARVARGRSPAIRSSPRNAFPAGAKFSPRASDNVSPVAG